MKIVIATIALAFLSAGVSAQTTQDTGGKKQCLIVAPAVPSPPPPWVKWEVKGSFNLKAEDIKESYKEKDLKDLHNKQGVLVVKIDPAGHQLEAAQSTCKEFVK
jgi:hypothetical protein